MKFKVGDRVKVICLKDKHFPKVEIGKITTITKVNKNYGIFVGAYEDKTNVFYEDELELVQPKQFTKSDLKERYIVKTRNGNEYIVNNKDIADRIINGKIACGCIGLNYYTDNLIENLGNKELDIVEVYKPKYETIWTRQEDTVKEMTVAEIEKQLGYSIKVVK